MADQSAPTWTIKLGPELAGRVRDQAEPGRVRKEPEDVAHLHLLIQIEPDAMDESRRLLDEAGFEAQAVAGEIVTGFCDLASVEELAKLDVVRVIELARPLEMEEGDEASPWGE